MTPSTQSPGELSGNTGQLKSEGELIARLRGGCEYPDSAYWVVDADATDAIMDNAADIIERLTERVARMEEERDEEWLADFLFKAFRANIYDHPHKSVSAGDERTISLFADVAAEALCARLSRLDPKE